MSERHAQFLRSLRLRQTKVLIVQFAVLAAFLGLWQLAATWRIIDPFITSQPSAIAQKFLELANDGSLGYNVAITVFETLVGFAVGTVVGNCDRGTVLVVGFPERRRRPLRGRAQCDARRWRSDRCSSSGWEPP